MEFSISSLDADAARHLMSQRVGRTTTPKIPASAHRHLLAQRLRRRADRLTG